MNSTVKNTTTDLTPALKIRNAMLMMQEAYEEELNNIKAKYLEEKAVTDRITNGKGCYSIAQTAKALKFCKNGKIIGRNTMFGILRDARLLNKNNEPFQTYISAEYFKVVNKVCKDNTNRLVTLVTGKGLVYLAKKFGKEIDKTIKADA